jgi:phospholipid/cholesterol/gamma-HCH transport system permease protein
MATAGKHDQGAFVGLVGLIYNSITALGDLSIFSTQTLAWMVRRWPSRGTMIPIFYTVGVSSVPVVAITGMFIGMVLAVQSYSQFYSFGMETHLGSIINISVVRELGPVLAATMLAGRVGSAMAAELATMRITEQIDAVAALGTNPVHYLVVPRFLACVLLIPLLTIVADFTGVMGGAFICVEVFRVEGFHYWQHTRDYVGLWDVNTGLIKSMVFGAAIGLICCHRGFSSRPGAEGVGRAATESFVLSFIAILASDFFLSLLFKNLYDYLWPGMATGFA